MSRPYKRELAYLESDGNQYIDSGITFEPTNSFKVNTKFAGLSTRAVVAGSYYDDVHCAFNIEFYPGGGKYYCRAYMRLGPGSQTIDLIQGSLSLQVPSNVSLTYNTDGSAIFIIDGVEYTETKTVGTYTSDYSVCLFLDNRPTKTYIRGSLRIYDCTIYKSDTLVRDFIPVLDNNDIPCMYDRVSKQLFYNQGTGTFLYGEKPTVVVYNPIPYKMNPLSAGFSPSELTFTARQAGSTVTLNKTGSPNVSGLQYKTKSLDWTSYTIGDTITLTNAGDYVKFQNTNNTLSTSNSNYVTFSMTGEIGASGNIQSMVNYQTTAPDYCFRKLFQGCSSLVTPPDMPATSVGSYSYGGMYSNSGVVYAPDLPATTVGSYCYYYMFENAPIKRLGELPAATLATNCYQAMCINCSELVKGPSVLPAGTLLQNCYYSMFEGCAKLIHSAKISATVINGTNVCRSMYKGCSSLVDAHVPQATVLKNYCYHSMYQNCISLKVPPALPATTLADYCYNVMFSGSGLTSIPELPATTLATSCYHTMFYGCVDLTGSVSLPANTLVAHCYDYMFTYTNITGITVNFTEWTASGTVATDGWVSSLKSSTGTFTKPEVLPTETGSSRIPASWNVTDVPALTLTALEAGSTVTLTATGNPNVAGIKFKTGSSDVWNDYTIDTPVTLDNIGDKVQFYNTNNTLGLGVNDYAKFTMTGSIRASGNCMSMINFSAHCTNWCFARLFQGCSSLLYPPELPSMHLATRCYAYMFQNAGLTEIPVLPATIMKQGCYHTMIYGCRNLAGSISLPAQTLEVSCYDYMLCFTKIDSIDVNFTEWTVGTDNWVNSLLASTGTFTKPSALSEETGSSRIPANWTIVNKD